MLEFDRFCGLLSVQEYKEISAKSGRCYIMPRAKNRQIRTQRKSNKYVCREQMTQLLLFILQVLY